jgi:hypothetical protein
MFQGSIAMLYPPQFYCFENNTNPLEISHARSGSRIEKKGGRAGRAVFASASFFFAWKLQLAALSFSREGSACQEMRVGQKHGVERVSRTLSNGSTNETVQGRVAHSIASNSAL